MEIIGREGQGRAQLTISHWWFIERPNHSLLMERFGLTSQARRAAASAPANIAEGCMKKDLASFGSLLMCPLAPCPN